MARWVPRRRPCLPAGRRGGRRRFYAAAAFGFLLSASAAAVFSLRSSAFAAPEAPSVQATLAPSEAHLGDLITLDIVVTHPPELLVGLPALAKEMGTFELYASTQIAGERSGPLWTDHFRAQLQNFTTGQQTLPAIAVPYRDPMGKDAAVLASTLTVTITDVPPGPKDKGDIRGIKGVAGPVGWSPWWWLLVAMALGAVGWALWQKRRRVIAGPPPPPPVPPDEAALRKLRDLEASGWLAEGKIKEFYSAVSEIVRAYIEGAFGVPALERTTGELMRALQKKSPIAAANQIDLRSLLDDCDLVKFAKFRPEADEARKAHAMAVRFVEQTKEM